MIKGKKGMPAIEIMVPIIVGLAILTVLVIASIYMKSKGGSGIDFIDRLLRFIGMGG